MQGSLAWRGHDPHVQSSTAGPLQWLPGRGVQDEYGTTWERRALYGRLPHATKLCCRHQVISYTETTSSTWCPVQFQRIPGSCCLSTSVLCSPRQLETPRPSINQSINQFINQIISQSIINQSVSQSIKHYQSIKLSWRKQIVLPMPYIGCIYLFNATCYCYWSLNVSYKKKRCVY